MKSLLGAVLLTISLVFVNICASARTLTENALPSLPAGANESSLANAVPADVLKNLPDIYAIPANASNITENALPGGANESSIANAVPTDALKNLPTMNAIPANISNNSPAIDGLTHNASSNLSGTINSGMQNAMQGNVTPQLPTIPQMPDFSALSNLSLPPMPSAPKLPKIPTNISIMGLAVPIPKFVTTIFNGGQS